MKSKFIKVLVVVLSSILLEGSMASADDFNPANPPEPQTLSKLKVTSTPSGVARVSGTGRYLEGTRVYVNTSVIDTDYVFKRWERNGETISTSRSFYYTTGATDETLTAVYEYVVFNPDSPAEPSESYKWRLYLESDPEEGCSFNLDNGSRHVAGEAITVNAYPNQGFLFCGWYEGDRKISDSPTFSFTMPRGNYTLMARFTFVPDSPDDPKGGYQENVDNKVSCDVNGDGDVNVVDSATIISYYLSEEPFLKKYDVNGDSSLNVVDSGVVISEYLAK